MQVTTRLLLPFTQEVDSSALDWAVRLACQRRATLVLLALLPVEPGRNPRPELLEQAYDFLLLTRRKAERQGVKIESSQMSTHDVVRSIEAFASEMQCEGVVLFWGRTHEALLKQAEARRLIEHSLCNVYTLVLPEQAKRKRSTSRLHVTLPGRRDDGAAELCFAQQTGEPPLQQHRVVYFKLDLL